jgi:hypothetical protein
MLGKHAATAAVPYSAHRIGQRSRERISTLTITLKQMESDSLRRFLTNAWHATQAIDQANK